MHGFYIRNACTAGFTSINALVLSFFSLHYSQALVLRNFEKRLLRNFFIAPDETIYRPTGIVSYANSQILVKGGVIRENAGLDAGTLKLTQHHYVAHTKPSQRPKTPTR
jgi:hypothetical protein